MKGYRDSVRFLDDDLTPGDFKETRSLWFFSPHCCCDTPSNVDEG